jgi:hypothetical protein
MNISCSLRTTPLPIHRIWQGGYGKARHSVRALVANISPIDSIKPPSIANHQFSPKPADPSCGWNLASAPVPRASRKASGTAAAPRRFRTASAVAPSAPWWITIAAQNGQATLTAPQKH